MSDPKKLSDLLVDTIKSGEKHSFDENETLQAHKQFASECKDSIEEIRSNRGVLNQDIKNIMVR